MIVILMLKLFSVSVALEEDCDMRCSNIIQRVCGKTTAWDGTVVISSHHNVCHLNKIKCRLKGIATVTEIPNEKCRIVEQEESRRVLDFGIVGAHQACNHTCPTYCVDTYAPVCAQIWQRNMKKFSKRTMVNHCHVDLFSCSVGVNVTMVPLFQCAKNSAGLLFMSEMAAMKSMGFLEEGHKRRSSDVKLNALETLNDTQLDITESEMQNVLKRMYQTIIFNRLKKPIA